MEILSGDILRNCLKLGFMAARVPALKDPALAVFAAAREVAADKPAWLIGTAMVYAFGEGSYEKASDHLREHGVSIDSGDSLAKAWLGCFLMEAGRKSEGEKILKRVIDADDDPMAVDMAKTAIAP